MATISHIRGLLLEEVVLVLLEANAFRPVESAGSDPTLRDSSAGLQVIGRGSLHQADAVADFRVPMPFGYPTRLIVEAKCYGPRTNVGLPIVRNAVGVVKDISEYFVPGRSSEIPHHSRYHYRYAIFSATDLTVEAQRYAFAHDISIVPLGRNSYMRPILAAVRNITHVDFGAPAWNQIDINLREFRQDVRGFFRGRQTQFDSVRQRPRSGIALLQEEMTRIGGTLLARANNQLVLFLTPLDTNSLRREGIEDRVRVSILYEGQSWYLVDEAGRYRFSFDLPRELFLMYADSGVLTQSAALDLKEEQLGQIEAIIADGESVRLLTLTLDGDWLQRMRRQIAEGLEANL